MNKTYRLIWNELTQAWLAVSEVAKAHGKCASGALLLVASGLALAAPPAPNQLPGGGNIVGGAASGTISTNGSNMTITQNVQRMIANWDTFNIGAKAGVQFVQPSSSAIALNRVLSQDPTQILGRLSANGLVMLMNPAGVVFGQGSQVNVGALVASSLAISDANFLAGNYSFASSGIAGSVVNQGRIVTPSGGIVALIAPVVKNEGSIETPKGSTLLAAADKVTVDFTGDGLITYSLDAGAANALVENSGSITADGGVAVLTAKAADAVSQAVVNNSGLVRARTLDDRSGRILLLADMDNGEMRVGGTLDASAPNGGNGGFIETSGHVLTMNDARIDAGAASGLGGTWLIDPQDLTINATGAGNIQTALNSGTNVTATTSACSATYGTCSGSTGNLTLASSIAKTAGGAASLTLIADGLLLVNSGVTVTDTSSNALSLNLQATGPIRFADNASAAGSVNIHGALYMRGKAGGATSATGNSTYADGIYVGNNTALTAASMTLYGQGVLGATGAADGAGVKLASAASLTSATGAIVVTGIGGKGGNGANGAGGGVDGSGTGMAGGTGAAGAVGGDGINLANTAAITGASVALTGTGGDGGSGGTGGTGGSATSSWGYNGGTGGAGGVGGTGGSGIAVGASTVTATSGTIATTGTGGKGGTGGNGGNGGNGSNNTYSNNGAGGGGSGGAGGNGGTSGSGFVLGSGATVAANSGTIGLVSAGGAAGTGGFGGGGGNGGSTNGGCGTFGFQKCYASNGGGGSSGGSGSSAVAFSALGAGFLGAANGGSSSANLSFSNDSMSLGSLAIQSTGALSLQTKTASTLIDLGTYTANATHLQLGQGAFWNGTAGNFKDGFSGITIGSASQTGAIAVSGLTYSDALTLIAGGAGGTVTVAGAVTDAGSGSLSGALTLNAAGAVTVGGNITTHNQGVSITGASYTQNDFDIVAGSGDISITADSVAFNTNTGSNPLQTTGALTLRPKTLSTAMTLASANTYNGGTGLDLSATEIGYLKNSGASTVTLGRSDGTGAMTLAAAVDLTGKIVNLDAGSITDSNTTIRIVTASTLNLLANGAIGGTGNNAIDFVASNVSANTTGNASAYLTSTAGYALGASNVGSGTLSLATTGTGGSVTQSGAVTAGTLTAILAGTNSQLNLGTQTNVISNLAGITAGGGFSFSNGNTATTVSANITTSAGNGAVSIDTGTGTYTQNANIDIASGSGAITVTADNMVINANAGNNAFGTTGALTLKTSTATRGITLGGTTEIAGQLTLQDSEISAFASNTPSNITIGRADSTGIMTIGGAIGLAGNTLNLKAGAITDGNTTNNIITASTLNLQANGNIGGTGGNAIDFVASTVSANITDNGSVYLSSTGGYVLGATNVVSGTLSLGAGGAITQSGAATAASLKLAASGQNVTLSDAGNSFGAVNGTAANLTLTDVQGINVGALALSGNLNLTVGGNVTAVGALTVGGATTLNAAGHDVNLDYSGTDFTGRVTGSAHSLTLRDANDLVLYNLALSGNLNLTAVGAISQQNSSDILTVAGTTTLSAGSDITLGGSNINNDFTGAVSVTSGRDVQITAKNDLHFGSANLRSLIAVAGGRSAGVSGNLFLDAGTTITASGSGNSVSLIVGDNSSKFVNNAGVSAIKLTGDSTSRWLVFTNDPYNNGDVLGGLKSYNEAIYGTGYFWQGNRGGSISTAIPATITQTGNRYVLKVQASAIPGYDPNKVTISVIDVHKTYGDAVTLTTADNTSIVYASGTMPFAEFSDPKPTWLDVSSLTLSSAGAAGTGHVGTYDMTATGSLGVNSVFQGLPTMSRSGTSSWSYNDGTHYVNLSDSSQIIVAPRTLSLAVGGGTVADKTYDGTSAATFTTAPSFNVGNVVNGDTVNLTGSSGAQFDDKNVGTNKLVTLSGLGVDNTDYVLPSSLPTYTASITPRSITVAATGVNKTYDATDVATAALGASSSAAAGTAGSGYILGDHLGYTYTNAVFDSGKNAGDNKAVTVNGIALDGVDAGNYTLVSTTAATTANIAKRGLTLSSLTGSKVYDGSTDLASATLAVDTVNVVGIDVVTGASGAATFDTRHAGTGKTLTADLAALTLTGADAGNYTLGVGNYVGRGDITPKAVTITAGNVTKTYDGTSAYITNTGDVAALSSQLGVAGDSFSAATISYDDRHAGTGNKTVTLDSLTVADGNGGGNYAITLAGNSTSTINQAAVTVSTSNVVKTYDGTTAATGSGTVVSGQLFGSDALDASGLTYAFADKNAGIGNKRVIIGGSTVISDGNGGGNYTVTLADNTSSTINKAALTVTASSASKTYDGTTAASGNATVGALAGASAGEVVNTAATPSFADKNAGSGKTVNASGLTIKDSANADVTGNYDITYVADTTGVITPRTLHVSFTGQNKVYDGTTAATVTSNDDRIANDVLTINRTAAFGDPAVGIAKPVAVASVGLSGGDAGNYTVAVATGSVTADITPLPDYIPPAAATSTTSSGPSILTGDSNSALNPPPVITPNSGGTSTGTGGAMNAGSDNSADAGNSDCNSNTVSGTLGNQGNDKGVGNAGGEKPDDNSKTIDSEGKIDNKSGEGDKSGVGDSSKASGSQGKGENTGNAGGEVDGTGASNSDSNKVSDTLGNRYDGKSGGEGMKKNDQQSPKTGAGGSGTNNKVSGTSGNRADNNDAVNAGTGDKGTGSSADRDSSEGAARNSGLLDIGGGRGVQAVQFVSDGDSTTLKFGAAGGSKSGDKGNGSEGSDLAGGVNDNVARSSVILLFSQSGDTVVPGGALTLVEQGQSLKVSAASAEVTTMPSLNPATMRYVTVDYRLPSGASTITVGVSQEDVLVVKVSPVVKAAMDDRSITLLGLAIARDRLNVKPGNVKGVVIQVEGAGGSSLPLSKGNSSAKRVTKPW